MGTYKVHEDAGHGWLEVRKSEIMETPVKVTPYSYQDENNVYLEEDCDKWAFLNYLESKGEKFTLETSYHKDYNPIRSMRHFSKAG